MSKPKNLAAQVREHTEKLRAEAARLKIELDEARDERARIAGAPLARVDLERVAVAELDQMAARFEARLAGQLQAVQSPEAAEQKYPANHVLFRPRLEPFVPRYQDDKHAVDGWLVVGAMAPLLKDAVSRVLDGMDFADAGLPEGERAKELAKIDQRIGALEAELDEIEGSLNELGAVVGRVEPAADAESAPAFKDPGPRPRAHRAVVEQRATSSATFDAPAPEPVAARSAYLRGPRLSDYHHDPSKVE